MNKLILSVFFIFLLFGCGMENSSNSSTADSELNNTSTSNTSVNNGGSSGDTNIGAIETGDTESINTGSTNQDNTNTNTDVENSGSTDTNTGSDNSGNSDTNTGSDNSDNTDTSNENDNSDTNNESDNSGNTDNNNEQTENKDNEKEQSDNNEGSSNNNQTSYMLHTIASYFPQTPSDTLPANNTYALIGTTTNANLSMQKEIENNTFFDSDNVSRNIIKSQIDFNNFVKENNIQPISSNNNAQYKTLPAAITTGTKWSNVWVTDILTSKQFLTNATCIYVSENVYYFLDDRVSSANIDLNRVKEIDEMFAAAYQKVHEKCGYENDVDGNGKIIFLFTPIGSNIVGFFNTGDKYSDAALSPSGSRSNEADMMYIESDYLQKNINWELNKEQMIATLTHEFHHMALFDVRYSAGKTPFMDYWLNEGLSTLTAYYTGYPATMKNHLNNFFIAESNKPLINNTQNLSYGYSYLFMRYFYHRFGDTGLQKLIKSQYTGYQAVEEATGMNFNDLYKDFIKMILVTGRNITDDPIYNVPEFNHKTNTSEYLLSYISLAEMFDTFINTPQYSNLFTTYSGYMINAAPYTFQYKKWLQTPENLTLQGTSTTVFYSQF